MNEQVIYCTACVSEYIDAIQKWEDAPVGDRPEFMDLVRPAITYAPSWQSMTMLGQMVWGCVAAPACLQHLGRREISVVEKAVGSGLIPGRPGLS